MTSSRIFTFLLIILRTSIIGETSLMVYKYEGNAADILVVQLPVYFEANSSFSSKNYTFSKSTLENVKISPEQIREGKVNISKDGSETMLIPDGRKINIRKGMFKTMEELKEDASLMPQKIPNFKWIRTEDCNYSKNHHITENDTFTISANTTFVNISYGDKSILLQDSGEILVNPKGMGYSPDEEGLILTLINMRSCQVTYQGVYPMNQFGIFRHLNKRLKDVTPGSLVILVSLFDGSRLLNESSRNLLKSFGSSWSDDFLYRDGWVFAFVKGGKILIDVLIPNLGFSNTTFSSFDVFFKVYDADFKGVAECTEWPNTEKWNARRIFCSNHNEFGKLCDCENPLHFSEASSIYQDDDIPVSILTGGRILLLMRLLESLSEQDGLNRELIVISMDGYNAAVVKIAELLGIRVLHHRVEGFGGTRISRLLRFSLFNLLHIYPEAKYLITLEDDMVVAKDFYSFMQQVSPIFDLDATIWCATGFNIFSFPHTSSDPAMLYRGPSVPNLGWMMPKSIIIELLERWPSAEMYHNWDLFMALPNINKGRECIVPEVIRTNHPTGGGTHFGPSLFMERNFASRKLNEKCGVKIKNLERLIKKNYIQYINDMVANSTIVEFFDIGNLSIDSGKDQIYTIFIDKNSTNLKTTSGVIHNVFGSWNAIQINIWEAITYHYYNATILILSVPSPYSFHLPADYKFFTATSEDLEAIVKEETDLSAAMLTPRTHQGLLPNFQIDENFDDTIKKF